MPRKNFYISTDRDGNMPVLSAKPVKSCWVKYVNDKPVAIKPYQDQTQVWDYAESTFYALPHEHATPKLTHVHATYAGKVMPPFKGEIL